MKNTFIPLVLVCALILVSCTEHAKFLFQNNSGREVIIQTSDGKNALTIASGHQWIGLEFGSGWEISWDNHVHKYDWKYPSPISEYMAYGKATEPFALSLEADDKIYAHKIMSATPSASIADQPSGFPLVPKK